MINKKEYASPTKVLKVSDLKVLRHNPKLIKRIIHDGELSFEKNEQAVFVQTLIYYSTNNLLDFQITNQKNLSELQFVIIRVNRNRPVTTFHNIYIARPIKSSINTINVVDGENNDFEGSQDLLASKFTKLVGSGKKTNLKIKTENGNCYLDFQASNNPKPIVVQEKQGALCKLNALLKSFSKKDDEELPIYFPAMTFCILLAFCLVIPDDIVLIKNIELVFEILSGFLLWVQQLISFAMHLLLSINIL